MIILRFVLVLVLLHVSNCSFCQSNSKTPIDTLTQAIVEFDSKLVNLGEIAPLSKVTGKFGFINKGGIPLQIREVKAHCGCTVVNYSKNPILPGKRGEINVVYTASSKPGEILKTIVVVTNTYEKCYILRIKAKIKRALKFNQ